MKILKMILAVIFVSGFIINQFGYKSSPVIAKSKKLNSFPAEDAPCTAPTEWFPKTPAPTNSKPNKNSECDFYKWAWQTFLYITQTESQGNGRLRFLNFDTNSQLFANASPLFSNSKVLDAKKKNELILAPRLEKESLVGDLDAVLQAGSNGVLIDQNGRAIYYGQHINSVFVNFVKDNGYTDMTKLKNAPADQVFPKGSLELKSSWKIVALGEDASKFFTTKALVSKLITKNGKIVIDPQNTREETVALIGLHVVGVVEGHPEFIWATFEHNDNAPPLPEVVTDPESTLPVDTTRNWTLYAKGTRASDCNRVPGKPPQSPLAFVNEANQMLQPRVSVFRQFSFAGDDQIKDLNESVHNQLPNNMSVWKNYTFMGAVWLNTPERDFKLGINIQEADRNQIKNDPSIGEDPDKRILGGEREMSNTTMETFTQSTQSCFSCHTPNAKPVPHSEEEFPAKLIGISHVLVNAYIYSQQVTNKNILLNKHIK